MPEYLLLTMSRGDEHRLADWLQYHSTIGFNSFRILLDNPIDDSERVLIDFQESNPYLKVVYSKLAADGPYYDGLTPAARWKEVAAWRKENSEYIKNSGLPIVDPLSERQYRRLSPILENYAESGLEGWVSVLDVDEYLALPGYDSIQNLTESASHPRIRVKNFNFDTSGWDGRSLVRSLDYRWAEDAVIQYGQGWQSRVKSIVEFKCATPLISVHAISKGSFEVVDSSLARLHHYKFPLQGIPIEYSVLDRSIHPNEFKLDG